MTSGTRDTRAIEPDDGSMLTPDVERERDGAGGGAPNVTRLKSLLGEKADARHVALVGLFVLAVFYTLHLAQALFLPIVARDSARFSPEPGGPRASQGRPIRAAGRRDRGARAPGA